MWQASLIIARSIEWSKLLLLVPGALGRACLAEGEHHAVARRLLPQQQLGLRPEVAAAAAAASRRISHSVGHSIPAMSSLLIAGTGPSLDHVVRNEPSCSGYDDNYKNRSEENQGLNEGNICKEQKLLPLFFLLPSFTHTHVRAHTHARVYSI